MKLSSTRILSFLTLISLTSGLRADEGMWLLNHLHQVYPQMKAYGLKLTPEDIYSINQSSLKDAVVSLQFCTAEIVSPQGLILTNHHCAKDALQYHTDTINKYLDVGFWARSHSDELQAMGMTASILIRVEDVTNLTQRDFGVTDEADIEAKRQEVIDSLVEAAIEGTDYEAQVVDMYAGNQQVLFVYITYRDLRLVGVPPTAVGNFGGDTDNWMWPRHTGDFAVLRIYTAPDGSPADYSDENIPLVPKHYFPVSLKGVEKGDFAMIMGFPGQTDRYSTSYSIAISKDQENPERIRLRDTRLKIWKESMIKDEAVRFQYSTKYDQISNYWKYFIGQNEGLERLNTIETKRKFEQEFLAWANANSARREKYGDVFDDFEAAYAEYAKYNSYFTHLVEGLLGIEACELAWGFNRLGSALGAEEPDADMIKERAEAVRSRLESHFKDYHMPTDQKVFAALMQMVYDGLSPDQRPKVLTDLYQKYKGNWTLAAAKIYPKTIFTSRERCEAFLNNPNLKKLQKDPLYALTTGMIQFYREQLAPPYRAAIDQIDQANKTYLKGLLEMNAGKPMYPDANSTERLTYGRVLDYYPRDAVHYRHYTSADGVVHKYRDGDREFDVPDDLLATLKRKDYGRYGKNGELTVCFLTDTDITGGNSGSPVLNAEGHLIGIAFDGNWEAMTGDLVYDSELKRTISVDIRYVLFIVDKYAGAKNIISEMTVVE